MATANPLLDILLTIQDVIDEPGITTERLAMRRACSDRQLKRYIAEARHLGADLRSTREATGPGTPYGWRCYNKHAIRQRLATWIDLERSRSLTDG